MYIGYIVVNITLVILGFQDFFSNFIYFSIINFIYYLNCNYKLLKITSFIMNRKLINLK